VEVVVMVMAMLAADDHASVSYNREREECVFDAIITYTQQHQLTLSAV
jgi:hypothetical protein